MIQITPAPAAVGPVRHAAASLLTSWGLSAICEDAVLCLSEAVTNSVLHAPATGTVTVAIERDRRRLRIEVTDGTRSQPGSSGPGPRQPLPPDPQPGPAPAGFPESEPKEHGWGLEIIAAVADRWGMDAVRGGHRVWFEKDIPAAAYPAVMP
ncbi:MAG: ATP-binding protein [Streptosporangiaceae bacterium]